MNKYELEQKKSLMKLVAQKVSQKIDSLPEISCLSERWIWELIQNAKDADNQFDKIHIQMELYDNKFIFRHNGCPFTESNIQSLVFHYSSKDDENKEEIQTTGKYGTGFMLAYIISKKIRLNCMLKSSPEEDDQIEKIQKQLMNIDSQLSQFIKIFSTGKSDQNGSVKKSELKQLKISAKSTANCDYYQKISLLMDRSYSSVDQLIYKLILIDKDLRSQIQHNEKNYKYVRDQFSNDTQFVFQDLSSLSFNYIRQAMASVKRLFPLTLLFNKKLCSIKFTNFSKIIKEPNFEIIRQTNFGNPIKVSGFNIFSSAIYNHLNDCERDQKSKITVQYLYEIYKDINAIVAFPVKIQNQKINLMRFSANFPRLFKQFPMIGCQNTGFNFAVTSRQFQHTQNRRQLILRQIQGKKCMKAQKNWNILTKLFIQLKSTYILLSTKVKKGKFNLFFQNNHHFLHQFNDTMIKATLQSIRQSIANQKIFTSSLNPTKLLSLSQLSVFYQKYLPRMTFFLGQSLFSCLYPNSLCQQQFRQMIQYISFGTKFKDNLQKMMLNKFYTIFDAVNHISEMGYQKFKTFFPNKKNAEIHLGKIYKFLLRNGLMKYGDKKIILNQNEQFISYIDASWNIKAKIQYDFQGKQVLFMIAKYLEIEFKNMLIHKQYLSLFKKHVYEVDLANQSQESSDQYENSQSQVQQVRQNNTIILEGSQSQIEHRIVLNQQNQGYFNKADMLQMITDYFQNIQFTRQILIKLGKVISSFSRLQIQQISMAKVLKKYRNIDIPFQDEKIHNSTIKQQQYMATLEELFIDQFYSELLIMYNQSKNLKEFSQNYLNNNKQIAINHIRILMIQKQQQITKFLNQMQEIVQCNPSSLHYLKDYNIISQADKQIYNKYFQSSNTLNKSLLKLQNLQKTLVHRKISSFSDKFQFSKTTYNQLFVWINNYYNQSKIKIEEKQEILNYTYSIYQGYIINNKKIFKQKFNTFKDIIHQRHLQFGKLLITLKDKDKDLICKIFKMKDKFDAIRDLFDHFSIEDMLATMYKIKREENL